MQETLASGADEQQQSRNGQAFHDVSSLKEMEPVTGIGGEIRPRFQASIDDAASSLMPAPENSEGEASLESSERSELTGRLSALLQKLPLVSRSPAKTAADI